MSGVEMIWGHPEEPGWYATVHCWEPHEGAFGGAHYWDGSRWLEDKDGRHTDLPIGHYIPQRFSSLSEAEAFADANDLGF
jgi:hypothetical protein